MPYLEKSKSASIIIVSSVSGFEVDFAAGSYGAMMLADLGAEVIRIETTSRTACVTRLLPPFADDQPGPGRAGYFNQYNQGKRSILLDLRRPEAVALAHGYAKASGKPMIAILHNLVGLLHANMAIYYAYIDRAPIFIVGATGPMDETKRRPRIDWIHTANVQGEQVRHYVKWDYQPTSIDGVPRRLHAGRGGTQVLASHGSIHGPGHENPPGSAIGTSPHSMWRR